MIKLLILSHNYPRFDGDYAGVFIALQAKKLTQFGIQPIVLVPHDKSALEYEEKDGVKIYRFRYADKVEDQTIAYRGNMHQLVLGSVSGIFKFKQFLNHFRTKAEEIIKSEQIDIIAGNWLVPSGMVMKPLMKTGLPMIMSSHGTDIRLLSKYFNVVYRYLKPFCMNLKNWTVVSSFLKDEIVKLDNRLGEVLDVLPLPHDETIFFKDESIQRDKNQILAVTRFTDQKRVDKLIKAFALVVEKNDNARLKIIGSGPLENELKLLIDKFGLNQKIRISSQVSQKELAEEYNRSAITVLNSYREGFGLALSEAMLCGSAVIGTNSGGIPDIINDKQTGLLVAEDDFNQLAEGMIGLLADDSLRENLASAGHEYAMNNYTSDKLAEKYAAIIKNALG